MATITETLQQEFLKGTDDLSSVIREGGEQLACIIDSPKSSSDEIKSISESFIRDISYTADRLTNRISELSQQAIDEKEQNAENIAGIAKYSIGKIMENVAATIINIKDIVQTKLTDFVENN